MRFLNNKNMMSAQDAAVKNAVEAEIEKFTDEINDIKERLESIENAQAAMPTSIETENLSADDIHADNVYAKNISVEEDISIQGNANAAKVTTQEVDTQDVKTKKVTATQEVKAPKGDFTEADIGELNVETLNLDTFNVSELNATKVDATTVEAENAEITNAEITNATVDSETVETLNVTDKVTGKDAEFTGNVTEKNTEIENLQVTEKANLAETEIETVKTGRIFVDPEKLQLIPENGWLHIHHISQGEFFIYLSDFTDITTQTSEFGNILFSGILEYRNHDKVANVRMSYGQKVKAFEEIYIDSNGEIWLKRGSAIADSRRVIILAVTEDDEVIDTWAEDAAIFDVSTAKIIELETGNETIHKGEFYQDGNAVIHGNLKVEGQIELEGLEAEHAEFLGASEKVTADDNGNLSVDGDAAITGDETVGGNITAAGDISGKDGSFSGDVEVTGELHATADRAKADEEGNPFSSFLSKKYGIFMDLIVHDATTLADFIANHANYANVFFEPGNWNIRTLVSSNASPITTNLYGIKGSVLQHDGTLYCTGKISGLEIVAYTEGVTLSGSFAVLENCKITRLQFNAITGVKAKDCTFDTVGLNADVNFADSAEFVNCTILNAKNWNSTYFNLKFGNALFVDTVLECTNTQIVNLEFTSIPRNVYKINNLTIKSYQITIANQNYDVVPKNLNLIATDRISIGTSISDCFLKCKVLSSYNTQYSISSSIGLDRFIQRCQIYIESASDSPGLMLDAVSLENCSVNLFAAASSAFKVANNSNLIGCKVYFTKGNPEANDYFDNCYIEGCNFEMYGATGNSFNACTLINNRFRVTLKYASDMFMVYNYGAAKPDSKSRVVRGNVIIVSYNGNYSNSNTPFTLQNCKGVRDNVFIVIGKNTNSVSLASTLLSSCSCDDGATAADFTKNGGFNSYEAFTQS